MIPGNILKKHILDAVDIINKEGIPKKRKSKKFDLVIDIKHYPPKYVISKANEIVNREPLNTELYSGGEESNNFLLRLGFKIYDKENKFITKKSLTKKYLLIKRQRNHISNSRCSECKNTIIEMLRNIYGSIKIEHKFSIPTHLALIIHKKRQCIN